METIYLSTVTPVYHGAGTLAGLVQALDAVRRELIAQSMPLRLTEAILVDDGSVDGSEQVLAALERQYDWVRVIRLSRNFGQHPATIAGILHAGGDWIATLDEDLQHPPSLMIPLLRRAIMDGADVVYAQPSEAVHDSRFRDYSSRWYKATVGWVSGNPHIHLFNSFRMARGSIARAAAAVSGHQTYFDLVLCWFTSRIVSVKLPLKDHRHIKTGASGYSWRKLLSHARRMLQSSELKVLRLGALIGFAAMVLAAVYAIYAVMIKIMFPEMVPVQGWTSIMVAVLFLGGLSTFLIGLVLEHLSLILMQTHGKPTFFEVDRRSDEVLRAWCQEEAEKP